LKIIEDSQTRKEAQDFTKKQKSEACEMSRNREGFRRRLGFSRCKVVQVHCIAPSRENCENPPNDPTWPGIQGAANLDKVLCLFSSFCYIQWRTFIFTITESLTETLIHE